MALGHELRHAVRSLIRSPAYTVVALTTLALGIGATTVIVSAVRAVLLRPLPFAEPDRLVQVLTGYHGHFDPSQSPPNFVDLRAQNTTLADLVAYYENSYALTGDGEPEQVSAAIVTGGFFDLLGVRASHGRALTKADDREGAGPAVVLGYGLWQRRFGGHDSAIGRTITLDGTAYQIVGVMPRGFDFPHGAQLWSPLVFSAHDLETQRGAKYLNLIGRLRPGVDLAQARADLDRLGHRLATDHPQVNTDITLTAEGLHDAMVGDVGRPLLVTLGAVALLLLVAGVNVAGLLLVRGLRRRRELTVRAALGASRGALVRSLLVESLLLSMAGGALGVVLALWGTRIVAHLGVGGIPFLELTRVDGPVLAFTVGLSLAIGALFGALPAWQSARAGEIGLGLRDDAAGTTAGAGRQRTRDLLVVSELALASALLVGAGLVGRSLYRLTQVDLGFEPSGALTFQVNLPAMAYDTPEKRAQFFASALDRLQALPGVVAAGEGFGLPLSGTDYVISGHDLDGRLLADREQARFSVQLRVASPGYFAALGSRLVEGRDFGTTDRFGAPPVLVVNEAAARLLWPGQSPLGHHLVLGTGMGQNRGRVGGEVVGVVADLHDLSPAAPPRPMVFLAHHQWPIESMSFVLRGGSNPPAFGPARAALRELDPNLPIDQVRTLRELDASALAQPRFFALLLGLFAMVALTLASVGVYGVVSQSVSARTRELGIRLALGAESQAIAAAVIRRALILAAVGAGAGLTVGLLGARTFGQLLFEVAPTDVAAYAAAALLLALVATVASWLPARRAARVDPVRVLREE